MKIIDPVVTVIAEDQTADVLQTPECLSSVVGQPVSVVRGYVDAKYSISSKTGGNLHGNVTVKRDELVTLSVDGSEDFTVEDARPNDKLVILSDAQVVKQVKVFFPPAAPDNGPPHSTAHRLRGECFEQPRILLNGVNDQTAATDVIPVRFAGHSFASCSDLQEVARRCIANDPGGRSRCPPDVDTRPQN
ncbi:hypothetical protein ACFWZ3_15660 [Frateuria sp. GZRR35]|uniref:hypothetical protein n=1 Tax=Frateuria sp. GZRR35 TaxID=3351536 RepID=UPI003EDBA02C